jgi:hypothetical protein
MAANREQVFVEAMWSLSKDESIVRGTISILRTLGYINEIQFSSMNTILTKISNSMIRHDKAETLELGRELKQKTPEEILPSIP